MNRYDIESDCGCPIATELWEDGDWCKSEDVEPLESELDKFRNGYHEAKVEGKLKDDQITALQREIKETKASAEHWDNESHKEVSRLQVENERLIYNVNFLIDECYKFYLDKINLIIGAKPVSKDEFKRVKILDSLLTKEKSS